MIVALWGLGCPSVPIPDPCTDPSAPTWDNFAEGHVRTWCTPCHTASLPEEDRQGAPVGVDFDTHADVVALADRVIATATGPDPAMPPLGGIDPDDTDRFAEWLTCGAVGEPDPAGPCDTVAVGPVTEIPDQAAADALCERYQGVEGLTVTGSAALPCLCRIDGSLAHLAGALALPALTMVSGTVTLADDATSLDAPELDEVGGSFVVEAVSLDTLGLPQLAHVGGEARWEGTAGMAALVLPQLQYVGALRVIDALALQAVEIPRLREIAGDLVLQGLPSVVALDDTRAVITVDGDLVISGLDGLEGLDTWGFQFLGSVGGDLTIVGNQALRGINGFTLLDRIAGDLVISGNASLIEVDGFDTIPRVDGDLVIRDNPRQTTVLGLLNLVEVGGTLVLEDLPQLQSFAGPVGITHLGGLRVARLDALAFPWLARLATVDGIVAFEDNPRLEAIDGLIALAEVGTWHVVGHPALVDLSGAQALTTVADDLILTDNAVLGTIDALGAVDVVGRDVTIRNNPSLPTAAIELWVSTVSTIGGTVTVEDNG